MDPQTLVCHNPDCPARRGVGQGNIRIQSRKQRRYRCTTCNKTFAATRATPVYRLEIPPETVTIVTTWLGHGRPPQAIVAAFGFDERTIARWQQRTGPHCQHLHEHLVQQGQVDLQHVQADELYVKAVGHRLWMAMAMAVPPRLWLGRVISPRRDLALITALVAMVRSCARSPAILVCVDGLASYITAFVRVFRHPVRTGQSGRPRLEEEPGLLIGQVIKQTEKRRVVGVTRRVVRGTPVAILAVLTATGTGTGIDTAYIERLNATFRAAAAPLTRRGRAIARTEETLQPEMFLVGCTYNFCWGHESLRRAAPAGASAKWQGRPPAMAAGLTDHRWTMREPLSYQIPLSPWVAPTRRGRPPKQRQPEERVAA